MSQWGPEELKAILRWAFDNDHGVDRIKAETGLSDEEIADEFADWSGNQEDEDL